MGGKPLSPDEVSLVEQMALLGHSHRAIAEKIGRTRSAVRNILNRGKGYSHGRICSDCPKPIRNENSTGRCKGCATTHNNRKPETKAKRVDGWRKRLANPLHYARLCQVAAANSRKAMADPEKRKAAVERARKIYETYIDTPEMRERLRDPELCRQKGRKITERRLSWCPPEYRGEYLHLINSKRVPAVEAREIVRAQVKADIAKLSPFERQMRALEKGAGLVANDRGSSLTNPADYGEGKWERLVG